MKKCEDCGEEKEADVFYGRNAICRECFKLRVKNKQREIKQFCIDYKRR